MNVLSLRINAVKSDDSFRIANQELFQIDVEEFWSEDIKQHLKLINDSITTEAQLRELKRFGNLISPANCKDQNENIANKLIRIFFQEKLKHPVKSIIQSSFNQSPEQDLLIICIGKEIELRIRELNVEAFEDCFHFITCLNEASQNFRPAIKAMGQQVNIIVRLITNFIEVCCKQLKTEVSPAQKNIFCRYLHCSLQAVIFCVKIYLKERTSDNSEAIDSEVKHNLDEINLICYKMLDNPDVPMDTKNNSSMLIVMYSKLMSNVEYMNVIKHPETDCEKRLFLIYGVINTIEARNFSTESSADSKELEALVQNLNIISVVLEETMKKSALEPTVILSISRSFMQMTKKLTAIRLDTTLQLFRDVTTSAISVAFLNLEHHMDSVRHLSRETMRNLAEISTNCDSDELIDKIISKMTIESSNHPNLNSTVVASIIPVISASKLLLKLPGFPSTLLNLIEVYNETNSPFDCYTALSFKSLEEIPFDEWFSKFVDPVIDVMVKQPPANEKRLIFEKLLLQFVKKDKRVLEKLLEIREKFNVGFVFLCLSTSKKNGCFDKQVSTEELWKGVVKFDEIKSAMIHGDDKTRTSALMLIVEARKTVEGFSEKELECFMYFLKYNINVQSPSMRQSIFGMVKNFFVRIQSVLQAHIRKKEQKLVDFYFNFLVQLQEFCLDNLFDGANFTRRSLSLRILFFIMEAVEKFFKRNSSEIWNQRKFDVLINVLNDSYEANKEMAIEIMTFIPKTTVRDFTSTSLQDLSKLVTSIKPPESLTASYLMELIVKFVLNVDDFDGEKSSCSPETLCMLTWCEKLLLDGLEVAEKSLIVASSTNPLYGLVLSIRHLISRTDLNSLASCHLWRDFFSRLLVICKRLTTVVAPVVNNSSPEGILPKEEILGLDEATAEEWSKIISKTTPQIILLCSWRVIKEVSLLLGEICLKAPVIKNKVGLLSVEQVLSIGDHFLELLSKTKHRGAFEQCFFGFSQLCLRLWTCHEPELHKLPSQMLHQMITSISGVEKENNELLTMKNLCATRRSAGLPFMIQALITSELKVSSNKNFHFLMKSLVRFCQHGEYLETRTHSLNILRSLFRCSDLNEAIGEYIADGIKCAILGYGADSWIERNSSTLLFSALMVRIFGVQRSKDSDELNVKNKMTGRLFFFRYPELYDFFMTQLTEAVDYVNAEKMNAKLHPLLLLLIRLYPSAKDGSENKLELSNFIPIVSLCSGCVELQTRILSAKFIATVLSPELVVPRISQIIRVLKKTQELPANIAHGALLQVFYLVKSIPDGKNSGKTLLSIMETLLPIGNLFKTQPVCFAAFLDIFIKICEKTLPVYHDTFKDGKTKFIHRLKTFLDNCWELNEPEVEVFGSTIVVQKLFLVKLLLLAFFGECEIITRLTPTSMVLNAVLLIMDFEYALSMQDEYEISQQEVSVTRSCKLSRFLKLKAHIGSDKAFKEKLRDIQNSYKDELLVVKSLDILSLMQLDKEEMTVEDLQLLVSEALSKPEHLKKSSLKYVNLCVQKSGFAAIDFSFLVELSTDSSFFVKSSASDFVSTIASNLPSIMSLDTMLHFSKSLLLLLMDDEEEIRERNVKIVMKLVGKAGESVVPCYAQELLVEFLINKLQNFEKYERMALVLCIVIDGSDGDNSLDEHIVEYRVFDKNEVNIFGENFTIKQLCLKALTKCLDPDSRDDDINEIVKACKKFKDCEDSSSIESFLIKLN